MLLLCLDRILFYFGLLFSCMIKAIIKFRLLPSAALLPLSKPSLRQFACSIRNNLQNIRVQFVSTLVWQLVMTRIETGHYRAWRGVGWVGVPIIFYCRAVSLIRHLVLVRNFLKQIVSLRPH
jgi:hypothetical protein